MTDKILLEIENCLEEHNDMQLYIDIFNKLDLHSQFQVIDVIKNLIIEQNLDTEQAIIQVFNDILQQMRRDDVYRITKTM
jgi:hypothetical protein